MSSSRDNRHGQNHTFYVCICCLICFAYSVPALAASVTRDYIFDVSTLSGSFQYDDTTATPLTNQLDGFTGYDATGFSVDYNDGSTTYHWDLNDLSGHLGVDWAFMPTVDPTGAWLTGMIRISPVDWANARFVNAEGATLDFQSSIFTLDVPNRWSARVVTIAAPDGTLLDTALYTTTMGAAKLSFNVDIERSDSSSFGLPSDSFAAAGIAGVWTRLDVLNSGPQSLLDVTGSETDVTVTNSQAGQAGGRFADNPSTFGDDQALLDDGWNTLEGVGVPVVFTVEGLPTGSYSIFTYAWDPNFTANRSSAVDVNGLGNILIAPSSSVFSGYEVGQTHSVHAVTIAAGEPIVITVTNVDDVFDQNSVNGFQIVEIPGDTKRIDFETRGDGSPIDSLTPLPSSEYQDLGVVITDSFQSSNTFFVQDLDPVVNDSSISGFIATATAAADVDPTWFELEFDVPAQRVAFDFLNPSGNIRVLTYDGSDVLLGDKLFDGSQRFVHVPSSSDVESRAGHAEVFGSDIVTVRIESGLPAGDSIEALHIDNLEWSGNGDAVIYSNFGPEDEYSINNGLSAPTFCSLADCPNTNGGNSSAFSFVSPNHYDLESVALAITDTSDPQSVVLEPARINVGIYANSSMGIDAGGSQVNEPSDLLGFETVTIPESAFCDPGSDPNCAAFSYTLPDSLTTVDFSQSGIRLLPGQRYWIGLHPNNPDTQVIGAWFWNILEEGLATRLWQSFGGGPTFEFDSVAVGAPWQRTVVETESAFRVTGRASPDLDPDMDGIETRVDLAPDLFSADFADISLGGTTLGSITNRADLSFEISDATDASAGIEVQVDDVGVGQGEIGVCGNISLELSAGDQLIFTCGSIRLAVFEGPLELLIDGDVRVWASSDAEVSILEGNAEQEFRVENNGILGEVRVESDGVTEVLMPGDSTNVTINDVIFLSSFE